MASLAHDQGRLYRERLAVYQAILESNTNKVGFERRMAPLELGVRVANVYAQFWSEIAENPPPATATGSAVRDRPM